MVIGDLPTKHTKYTNHLPDTGEAVPAERLEVTRERPQPLPAWLRSMASNGKPGRMSVSGAPAQP